MVVGSAATLQLVYLYPDERAESEATVQLVYLYPDERAEEETKML